jgi:hypothetical protein
MRRFRVPQNAGYVGTHGGRGEGGLGCGYPRPKMALATVRSGTNKNTATAK